MIDRRWKVRSQSQPGSGAITECVHSLEDCILTAERHRAFGWCDQTAWQEDRIEGKGFVKVADVELFFED